MTSSRLGGLVLRRAALLWALALAAIAVSCGGGGGSGNSNSTGNTIQQQVAACTQQNTPAVAMPSTGNSVPAVVDFGPCAYGVYPGSKAGTASTVFQVGTVNVPFTTVKICIPGTQTCQSIDHVMIDTGSTGLRIMSSVLGSTMNLPAVQVGGLPLLECVQFADGYSWGSIRTADVYIAGEQASALPMQVIGDSSAYTVPSACHGTNPSPVALNDVISFGANGVLGVGLYEQDCGLGCGNVASNTFYYTCATTTSCAGSTAQVGQQATNPVYFFSNDNNGVALSMPLLAAASGTNNSIGTLVFGINTNSNNQAASANLTVFSAPCANFNSTLTSISNGYTLDAAASGNTYTNSFIDSGSNGLYLPGTSLPIDPTYGWFIPSPATVVTLTGTQQGQQYSGLDASGNCITTATGTLAPVSFAIANANTVLFAANNGNDAALNSLGGPSSNGSISTGGIDWGLPFFYGRTIYVGLETKSIVVNGANAVGPFWAY